MTVGAGVSVGKAVSVDATVAEGIKVSVGGIGTTVEVGDAHEAIRKMQMNESPVLVAMCESMELILLDLGLSLNQRKHEIFHGVGSE